MKQRRIMLELIQRLIAFKYSCKLNHWTTTIYSQHLLFDRLQEDIDDFVDNIAEKYFMGLNKKAELSKDIINTNYINSDLNQLTMSIMELIENISKKENLTHGMQALLDNICESFCEKRALLTMK